MMDKAALIVVLSLLSCIKSFAASYPLDIYQDCKAELLLTELWMVNRQWTVADGCLVQVSPRSKPLQIYREYVFDQSGRFFIFDSTSGPLETATAMQNYFLLPATQLPRARLEGGKIIVILASGDEAVFNDVSPFLVALTGHEMLYREDMDISLKEGGNFKIDHYNGIYLNAGWKVGDRAYRVKDATSTFIKPDGTSCTLKNNQIFAYEDPVTRMPYYQPILMWTQTDDIEALNCFYPQKP